MIRKVTKTIISLVAISFIASLAAVTFAFAEPDGNKRKGKYTYRKVYKACMERGEVSAEKPIVNPADKTMAEWTEVFEKKDFAEFKCSEEWNNLSDEDILDIYSYLYSGAADSPTPAQCK